jgi:hypothetical protein
MKFPGDLEICATSWVMDEVNSGPLSVCREEGILNQGMISLIRREAMVEVLFLVVGKMSTHPEKAPTNTCRYLNCFSWMHVSEVQLPISCREGTPGLMC